MVLDFDPCILYPRVSGVSREEDVVARFRPTGVGETRRSANVRGRFGLARTATLVRGVVFRGCVEGGVFGVRSPIIGC